jgi:Mrp family chromosome partitioning ATPase
MRSQTWQLCKGLVQCLRSVAAGPQQESRQTLAALQQLHTATAAAAAAGGPGKLSAKRLGLADVQHVVAVASGKGGVGKSTVAGARQAGLPSS